MPSSPTRDAMLDRFRQMVRAEGPGAERVRIALNVPKVADTSVVAVTDSTTCAALSIAQADHFGDPPVAVTAIRIGATRYAVFDRGKKTGEWESVSIYDASFRYLVSMTF